MREIKITFLVLGMVLAVLNLITLRYWFSKEIINPKHMPRPIRSSSLILPYVVVHIDLKGTPPKLSYLESLLPFFKGYGVNGLLMEYEDMFPYDPKMALSAKNCYSDMKLKKFLRKAIQSDIEIIPFIPTFGHMEFVLKLKEYKELRETPTFFDSICPNNLKSQLLITEMIEQIIYFHNNISTLKYIHIGCDEVYNINQCNVCRKKEQSYLEIFIDHVKWVTSVVKRLSPHTKVLIWDDMFRNTRANIMKMETEDIEPVYWDYTPVPNVTHANLMKYHRKFRNIWIASAFKGADMRMSVLPNIKKRFLNHNNWMSILSNYKFAGEHAVYTFKGIILTGWSRYTHMDPPCETLPASVHSLAINLLVIKQYKNKLIPHNISADMFYKNYIEFIFNKSLKCNSYDSFYKVWCNNKSKKLVNLLETYENINEEINERFSNIDHGLNMVEYNIRNLYMNRIKGFANAVWCKDEMKKLDDVENRLYNVMTQFFEKNVVKEYLGYLMHSKTRLNFTTNILNEYLKID